MGKPNVTLDVALLVTKEITYRGSFRYGVRRGYLHVLCASQSFTRNTAWRLFYGYCVSITTQNRP